MPQRLYSHSGIDRSFTTDIAYVFGYRLFSEKRQRNAVIHYEDVKRALISPLITPYEHLVTLRHISIYTGHPGISDIPIMLYIGTMEHEYITQGLNC